MSQMLEDFLDAKNKFLIHSETIGKGMALPTKNRAESHDGVLNFVLYGVAHRITNKATVFICLHWWCSSQRTLVRAMEDLKEAVGEIHRRWASRGVQLSFDFDPPKYETGWFTTRLTIM